jgi:DNA-binding CsgD family transcriptional regulator
MTGTIAGDGRQAREHLRALADLPEGEILGSLGLLARSLPCRINVETVSIRLRDVDRGRLFHLVAAEGFSPREILRRALEPLEIAFIKAMLALGAQHSLARLDGLRWLGGEWISRDGHPAGVILVGSRTERRPNEAERLTLVEVATGLGKRLGGVDLSSEALQAASRRVAREAAGEPAEGSNGPLAPLRPRERAVLVLYTEGLAADEIGRLLYISPHTVRTHVKNAFRRLGVHSRAEAEQLVRSDEIQNLI